MLRALFLSGFLGCLFSFSLVSHPVSSCFLLLAGSLMLSFFVYSVVGYSWYLVLFCLVYVGGVYILFIYASLYSPNLFLGLGFSSLGFSVVGLVWFFVFLGVFTCDADFEELSHYLCSFGEELSYCFFCVMIFLGFGIISVLSSSKNFVFR